MSHSKNSTGNTRKSRQRPQTPSLATAEYERVRDNFKTIVRRAGDTIRDPQSDWPRLLLIERDGRITTQVSGFPLQSDTDKDYLANVVLPAVVHEHEPRVFGFAFSCWTVSPYADSQLNTYEHTNDSLAEHPARTEAVILLVFDDDENVEAWLAPVTRRHKRPPKLGPWSTVAAADGRFIPAIQRAMVGQSSSPTLSGARAETIGYYQALLTEVAPRWGDEEVEDAFLIATPNDLVALSVSKLTADDSDLDLEDVAQMIAHNTTQMKHFGFVLKMPDLASFPESEIFELYGENEVLALIVADDVGISALAVSVIREEGNSRIGEWAVANDPLPVEHGLFRYANALRATIR